MNTNDIKQHFPLLYDILVQRANEVVESKQSSYGMVLDKAEAFLSGTITSINNLMFWGETPENHEFWSILHNNSYSTVEKISIYDKYKTSPITIHNLWI